MGVKTKDVRRAAAALKKGEWFYADRRTGETGKTNGVGIVQLLITQRHLRVSDQDRNTIGVFDGDGFADAVEFVQRVADPHGDPATVLTLVGISAWIGEAAKREGL